VGDCASSAGQRAIFWTISTPWLAYASSEWRETQSLNTNAGRSEDLRYEVDQIIPLLCRADVEVGKGGKVPEVSRLYRDVKQDVDILLTEYCRTFHGPATKEMRPKFSPSSPDAETLGQMHQLSADAPR
jgi:hypothetical protein